MAEQSMSAVGVTTPNIPVETNQVMAQPKVERKDPATPKVKDLNFSAEELKEMMEFANQALKGTNNVLSFQFDDSLQSPIIRVVDQLSGEVIRQLPSEEIVRIAQSIESMKGVLFDVTA